jgi:DNA-binding response OmpR family regulator
MVSAPRTVLLIEDDEDIRGLIRGILTRAGLKVQEAGTGAAGVEAVRQHGPDIIVVDFGLPDFNGLEAIRRIRELSQAPVLMLTAYAVLADNPYEAGVNDLMTKPFSPSELRRRVEKLLAGYNQSAATHTALS